MARGRPRMFKCSEEEFRKICLDYLVNEQGERMSWRQILKDESFQDKTGYFRKVNGKRKPASVGSISYWFEPLGLREIQVFNHHQSITGRIASDITYEEWEEGRKGSMGLNYFTDESLYKKTISILIENYDIPVPLPVSDKNIDLALEMLSYQSDFIDNRVELSILIKQIYCRLESGKDYGDLL